MDTKLLRNQPAYTLDRETAPAMWLVGTLWFFHSTGIQTSNRSSFLEQVMPRGLGPTAHRHPLAVEGFYVLEGTVSFHVHGKKLHAEAGTLIHLPRKVPHTFTVESEEARVLNFYAPAGAEMQMIFLAHPAEERRRPTIEESAPPKNSEPNEIMSRIYGTVGAPALPFNSQSTEELLVTVPEGWQAGTVKFTKAENGPTFVAFELHWRLLASGADTENNYDLFDVLAGAGAGMPARLLGGDEVIYVIEGAETVESDGETMGGGIGSFTYMPAGSVASWKAPSGARLLVFHFPGGFDRALESGNGQNALIIAWLESMGTRFLTAMPLTPSMLPVPDGG
jgi:ethanolamine utilization protein EutQ (cupin superfamily)